MASFKSWLKEVADAIRAKRGTSALVKPVDFAEEIMQIEGVDVSGVTAEAADVLTGKTFVDSEGKEVPGSMPEIAAESHALGSDGTYTIPEGYHDGSGTVEAETVAGETKYATTSPQTAVAAKKFTLGAVNIAAITQTNLAAGNIKNGINIKISNGNTDVFDETGTYKGFYYASLMSSAGTTTFSTNNGDKSFATLSIDVGTIGFIPDVIVCMEHNQVLVNSVYMKKATTSYLHANVDGSWINGAVVCGSGAKQFNINASTLVIPVSDANKAFDCFFIEDQE